MKLTKQQWKYLLRLDGEVKNILINVGDMVKQGMPFVEIETIKNASKKTNKIADIVT